MRARSSSPPRPRCSPASSPPRAATTRSRTRRRQATARPRAAADARAGLHHAGRSTSGGSPSRSRPSADVRPPSVARTAANPYFASWVRQQVVDQLGGRARAFEGGLRVRRRSTSSSSRPPSRPSTRGCPARRPARLAGRASTTTPARCGRWSAATTTTTQPFNLATQGQRQPGSAFKPFVLAEALQQGISPELRVGVARSYVHRARHARQEKFVVNNYEDAYAGVDEPRQRDRVLRQLRLRRSSA